MELSINTFGRTTISQLKQSKMPQTIVALCRMTPNKKLTIRMTLVRISIIRMTLMRILINRITLNRILLIRMILNRLIPQHDENQQNDTNSK